MGSNETVAALATLLLVGLGLIILAMMLATPAKTREVCLSKHEARQLWPKKHLYWYSSDHCWSNRRGPPSGIKIDKVPAKEAMAREEKPEPGEDQDHCCWPVLDTDANDNLVEPPASFTDRWYDFPNVFSFFRQRMIP
jgi:hypothetical protein